MSFPNVPSLRSEIVFSLDRDIAEMLRLATLCVVPEIEDDFISKMMSCVLSSIILEDTGEAFDGFTRIVLDCDFTQRSAEIAWGQYVQLLNGFFKRYRYAYDLIEELKDLLSPDDRSPVEELFEVACSNNWRVLRIR